MKRKVFYVSDQTGMTALFLGQTLLSQFRESLEFSEEILSFVDTNEEHGEIIQKIRDCVALAPDAPRPIVVSTFASAKFAERLRDAGAFVLDAFESLIGLLEGELKTEASHKQGIAHAMGDSKRYQKRMEALNFAVDYDDYKHTAHDLNNADIIVVGVSRSGKTPTSIFLASYFFYKVANFPLTLDMGQDSFPPLSQSLVSLKQRMIGLTIDPSKLREIRAERRGLANLRYASADFCRMEVSSAESFFRKEGIDVIDVTRNSVLEIAARINEIRRKKGLPTSGL